MKTKFIHLLVACVLATLLGLPSASAQTVTGSITGQITDQSGAVINGATITVENTATGVTTTGATNETGVYTIRFLPIGNYSLSVEASGFAKQTIPPFALEINQTAKVNASLRVGSSTTVVVQEDFHPLLDATDATLGNTLSATEIANFPLNGRNFSSLTMFQPGAIATDPNGMTGNNAIERNTYNSGQATINGNRAQGNNYTLEGADNNEPQNNLIGYNPAPDAIAEVRVVSANANASYGNANGGAVVTILKSGTNGFHGSMYGLLDDQNLDANKWENGLTNSPKTRYTQSIFGATFGGPVVKNRLFFFADYEGIRRHTAQPDQQSSVLTPAMLQGDFSAFTGQLYDTQNNFAPYAGNQIPVVNPVAQFLAANPTIYPVPNRTPLDGLILDNYVGPQTSFVRNNQEDFKVDWTPNSSDKISGFYSQGTGNDFTSSIIPTSFPANNTYPTKISGASWVHSFSPAVINEARFGFTRVRWNNGVPSDPSGLFGLGGEQKVGIPFSGPQTYVGFTNQSISGGASSIGNSANPQVFTDNTFNYQDNLTWQHGRHLLSIGGQAVRYQQNYLNAGNDGFLGQFSYNGQYTGLAAGGGYGPADFVLGRISNVQLASPLGNVGNRQWRLAGYLQDDFKISSRLTLNLGVRYEYDQPWYEQNNKTANVLPGGIVEYAGKVPALAAPGAIVCKTRACYNANYKQFMPRLGFAYQLSQKFVVRGGYGATSFFEGYSFNQRLTSSPPFSLAINQNSVSPSTGSGGTPFTVTDAFSQPLSINNSLYSVWPQNNQPAYIQQYNLTTEYALTDQLSVSVGYHGQSGNHLADYRNGNQLTLQQALDISTLPTGGAIPAADQPPYFNLVGENGLILITESQAQMNYNSGQLTVRQRTRHGLEYTLNYTYSKSLTDTPGNYAVANSTMNGSSVQNGYDLRADWGPSGMDIRHAMNFVSVYDLPFGKGRAYGGNANRALDSVLGGWRLATTALLYSGFPVTISDNGASNTNNVFSLNRPNQYRPLIVRNRTIQNWWGTDPSAIPCLTPGVDNGVCAYGQAAPFTFGTARNDTERGPGYRQVDLSLFKDFHVWHEHTLGFRADFFNVFNIASYGYPNGGNGSGVNINNANPGDTPPNTGSFGLISTVRSPPRQIQLSLHYAF